MSTVVTCPHCGKGVRVTAGGALAKHTVRSNGRTATCPNSGQSAPTP